MFVTNDNCILLDNDAVQSRNTDANGALVSLPIFRIKADTGEQIRIDLTDAARIKGSKQKLAMANQILAVAGFSADFINHISEDKKIEMTTGQEFGVTRAGVKSYDTVTQTHNSWKSTLTYTRISMTRYFFTNTAEDISAPFKWGMSIAVQGFAMENTTFKLTYRYSLTGDSGIIRNVSDSFTSEDNGFDAIADAGSGTGVSFQLKYSPLGITTTNEWFYMSCYGTNSNVNLPGPAIGDIGGAFNVYGNVILISGPLPVISISYPWGISVSGTGSSGVPCKTTLTAALYRARGE